MDRLGFANRGARLCEEQLLVCSDLLTLERIGLRNAGAAARPSKGSLREAVRAARMRRYGEMCSRQA